MAFPRLPPHLPRFCGGVRPVALVLAGLTSAVAAAADWRSEPPVAALSAALEAQVTTPGDPRSAAAWRRALEAAPVASRLGGPLCNALRGSDPRLASLVTTPPESPPSWLDELGEVAPSLRLAIAERLAAAERYDDALRWTDGVDPASTYSPALACYVRLVALRMTVDDEAAAEELARLDEFLPDDARGALGPARGWLVEALRRELEEPPQPLPTVARKMGDVERRLALREAGAPTQTRQQQIIDELDKLIKQLEDERKQQQAAAAAAGGGGAAPSSPAEESRPSDLKGPGEVDRKRLVSGDAWGTLPPAERERLTQAITRDFPPHYRSLIEDYFRTLAEEDGAKGDGAEAAPEAKP